MENLEKLSKLIRYYILLSTTSAGSGHLTSSLSAVEIMTVLFFKYFRYDIENPENPANDHLIFSKGHASPLFYALWAAAGKIDEEDIKSYRDFDSKLEGHPSMRFAYTEAPTGSLGQGLSVGLGIALNGKYLDKNNCRTFVLLGDGEMAEGQVWEALQLASFYKLNNLVAILDVNRLGQSGETMLSWDVASYELRVKSFGWRTYLVSDGHNLDEVNKAYETALKWSEEGDAPIMIIAKTIKGKGISFLENKENWHGKALDAEQFEKAVVELGNFEKDVVGEVKKPSGTNSKHSTSETIHHTLHTEHQLGEKVATRKAYGTGLVRLGKIYPFAKEFPERYFEMFIAEQNMVSAALGLSSKGKVPFVSTFGAFMTRAFDQIRMVHLSAEHLIFSGSHTGVSIGQDGPSQMGLEDIAMFRTLLNTTVFYPCDAVSTERLVEEAYRVKGIVYIRTSRPEVPVIYNADDKFKIGGSKVLKNSESDQVTLVAAGVTVFEALKAYEELEKAGMYVRVIDAYSIKPIDSETIVKAAEETGIIITIEDHSLVGGLGDAVLEVLSTRKDVCIYKMGVTKIPRSGKPEELLDYVDIYAEDIVQKIKKILQ